MALAEWRRAYVEDWTCSSWLYMICVSPVSLDAWFDKSKERSLLVCRVFTWCTMFGNFEASVLLIRGQLFCNGSDHGVRPIHGAVVLRHCMSGG